MSMTTSRLATAAATFAFVAAMSSGALAQKKYDPGATDTEIKIGSIMPYSGPVSAVSALETDSGFSGREDFWIIAAIQERR